jgi:hypothetical protein
MPSPKTWFVRYVRFDQAKALDTLRHEFIEYLLTRDLVAPYKRLINKLISLFEEEMYDRKKKLIEKLQELKVMQQWCLTRNTTLTFDSSCTCRNPSSSS